MGKGGGGAYVRIDWYIDGEMEMIPPFGWASTKRRPTLRMMASN